MGGAPPILVGASPVESFSARFEFVNGTNGDDGEAVPAKSIRMRLDRVVGRGVHEDYDVWNHGAGAAQFCIDVRLGSDFVDLMNVHNEHFVAPGVRVTAWEPESATLLSRYERGDFRRALRIQVVGAGAEVEYEEGRLRFSLSLEPGGHWRTCVLWEPCIAGEWLAPVAACHDLLGKGAEPFRGLDAWRAQVTRFSTGKESIDAVVDRAVDDLCGLRLHRHNIEVEGADRSEQDPMAAAWVPAGGVPWYLTLFGRDALVCALQSLALSPQLARATLGALAPLQATAYDDRHDAEPGKIPHEWRHGELAHFGEIPQTPYYGDHGATALFVWVAAEHWRWTGDRGSLEQIRPHIDRALAWIDRDGDRDGDGLQEYGTRAGDWGAYNQGWKDSDDAIVHADGTIAELPIALVEQQGYVVAAKRAWATVLDEAFDDTESASRLRTEAGRLAALIEERFWWEAEGTYYLGLDGAKRPIASVASNAGHLLWAGAASPARAATVARRLLAPDMWSGWGVRTLSSGHPAYNPYAYHRGSVWPHDNGIFAAGLASYGHVGEASKIAQGLFDASVRFERGRLPEVFAGVGREPGTFPTRYPGANVPQAWAAAAPIHILTAILGLRPVGVGDLTAAPGCPDWLAGTRVRGLRCGDRVFDLDERDGRIELRSRAGPCSE